MIQTTSLGRRTFFKTSSAVAADLVFNHGRATRSAFEDIAEAALHHGMNRIQVDEVIEKLKRQGDIFEPKRGFVQRIT